MASISLNGDTSGSIIVQAPAIAGSGTLTLPTGTATLGIDGPAFGAYRTSNQSISANTFTKVAVNVEEYDTASCFDTTNNRFTPTVAGYYFLSSSLMLSSGSPTRAIASIYKNGVEYKRLCDLTASGTAGAAIGSCVIYLNGSTDYVELWTYWNASIAITGNQVECNFYGCFLRGA
jgi:hypothetical protein